MAAGTDAAQVTAVRTNRHERQRSETVVERALAIARSGAVTSTTDVRRRLQAEGYSFVEVSVELGGAHIRSQLRDAIIAARGLAQP